LFSSPQFHEKGDYSGFLSQATKLQSSESIGNELSLQSELRRDFEGSIVISQSEIMSKIWFRLLNDSLYDATYCIWALQAYITALNKAGIEAESFVTVFLIKMLSSQNKYTEISKLLQMRLLPDSERLASEMLLLVDALNKSAKDAGIMRDYNKIIGKLSNIGIEMFWRCGERVRVIRWLLEHGFINEAINLCLKSRESRSQESILTCEAISGADFLKYSLQAYKNCGEFEKTERLFERLNWFLRDWDPKLFETITHGIDMGSSGLTRIIGKFPPDYFSSKKCSYFNHLYGLSS
jgi:tetratricopeptide (TPR) repeat protein